MFSSERGDSEFSAQAPSFLQASIDEQNDGVETYDRGVSLEGQTHPRVGHLVHRTTADMEKGVVQACSS